ncbi:MAG: HAD family hydrolase [Bacteroidaceae bacterium]|nr:HAD family hydrolase [Bacteroidaceae bacterium]
MTRALLFDYGGTLDTCGVHWYDVLRRAWAGAGLHPDDALARDAYIQAERALSEPGAVATDCTFRPLLAKKLRLELAWLRDHGLADAFAKESVEVKADRLAAHLDTDVRSNLDAVRPMLRRLRRRYKTVLVSNFYGNLPAVLRDYGLDGLFDAVVESAAVGIRKPDPALWRLAVETAGCHPDECTAIGDSLKNDIRPARAAGCRTVWLNSKPHTSPLGAESVPLIVVANYAELEYTLMGVERRGALLYESKR